MFELPPPRISFQKTVRLIDNTSKIVHFDKNPDGKMSLFFSFLLSWSFLGHSCKPGATAECVSRCFQDLSQKKGWRMLPVHMFYKKIQRDQPSSFQISTCKIVAVSGLPTPSFMLYGLYRSEIYELNMDPSTPPPRAGTNGGYCHPWLGCFQK